VNAQKLADEKASPYLMHQYWKRERRSRDFDHFAVAHSSMKASPGGYRSSTKSMDYYNEKLLKRKNELMEKSGKKGSVLISSRNVSG
jgi:hypothetical protein